jgi:hypothetical protein
MRIMKWIQDFDEFTFYELMRFKAIEEANKKPSPDEDPPPEAETVAAAPAAMKEDLSNQRPNVRRRKRKQLLQLRPQ